MKSPDDKKHSKLQVKQEMTRLSAEELEREVEKIIAAFHKIQAKVYKLFHKRGLADTREITQEMTEMEKTWMEIEK